MFSLKMKYLCAPGGQRIKDFVLINETGKSPNLRFGRRRKLSHGIEFIRAYSPTRIWLKKETQQLGPLIHTTWARTQVRLSIASFNKSIFYLHKRYIYCGDFLIIIIITTIDESTHKHNKTSKIKICPTNQIFSNYYFYYMLQLPFSYQYFTCHFILCLQVQLVLKTL